MNRISILFLAFCLVAVAFAAPDPGNKSDMKKKLSCAQDCGDKYEPICARASASPQKERLLSFGSECVLANYNCDHPDDVFEIKSKGECGGNVSVRLS